jgi:hypothetical protein
MTIEIVAVLLLAFVSTINAACIPGNGPSSTLVSGSCTNAAGPALGYTTAPDPTLSFIIFDSSNFAGSGLDNSTAANGRGSVDGEELFDGHGFTTTCECDNACTATVPTPSTCSSGYAINIRGGGQLCLRFGDGLQLPNADSATATTLRPLPSSHLAVSIEVGGNPPIAIAFTFGAVATSNGGLTLRALVLKKTGSPTQGLFFSACGPFILQDQYFDRKRALAPNVNTLNTGVFSPPGSAVGEPHLAGAHGIKFDVFGAPGANYSLLVAPAFEVNMQLAKRGHKMRFMTAMTVLYRGKSFTITPWTAKGRKHDEMITHFESLGSKISIKQSLITIELCAGHTISFATHHNVRSKLNYLNFEMQVPGCHDSYGGLLGQTYQCKYATEKFKWSRDHEEDFRIATLDTPSGSYSSNVECAHEDEYHGKPMSGGSFSNSDDALSML